MNPPRKRPRKRRKPALHRGYTDEVQGGVQAAAQRGLDTRVRNLEKTARGDLRCFRCGQAGAIRLYPPDGGQSFNFCGACRPEGWRDEYRGRHHAEPRSAW